MMKAKNYHIKKIVLSTAVVLLALMAWRFNFGCGTLVEGGANVTYDFVFPHKGDLQSNAFKHLLYDRMLSEFHRQIPSSPTTYDLWSKRNWVEVYRSVNGRCHVTLSVPMYSMKCYDILNLSTNSTGNGCCSRVVDDYHYRNRAIQEYIIKTVSVNIIEQYRINPSDLDIPSRHWRKE